MDKGKKVILKPDLTPDNTEDIVFEERDTGWLRIWVPPQLGHAYVMGADTSSGYASSDWQAAYVYDLLTREFVARIMVKTGYDLFASMLQITGIKYNFAFIGVEVNHSFATAKYLHETLGYTNIYIRETIDTIQPVQRNKLGWHSTHALKRAAYDRFAGAFRANTVKIYDIDLIFQMQGIFDDGTKISSSGTHNDDLVDAAVLTLEMASACPMGTTDIEELVARKHYERERYQIMKERMGESDGSKLLIHRNPDYDPEYPDPFEEEFIISRG